MRVWRLKYSGLLKTQGPDVQDVAVDLDLRFESSSAEHFDYNRDLSSALIADSIAREAWNEKFYSCCAASTTS